MLQGNVPQGYGGELATVLQGHIHDFLSANIKEVYSEDKAKRFEARVRWILLRLLLADSVEKGLLVETPKSILIALGNMQKRIEAHKLLIEADNNL